ncbi:hypothetical protein [uncultured Duncaniella sp.]|uniref:hypothetical protein n=3 Tax=uncultured Duncaniella sp. TaxID=2768039 RepID=UPI0025B27D54|nr:hypothetical protein [uncultured Duncaniella sp.]
MRFISFILATFIMLMCTAPAFEHDTCVLHETKCSCADDNCGKECDSDCNCCSPFIACTTCSGFVVTPRTAIAVHINYAHIDYLLPASDRIPYIFISVDTPPPVHC